MANKMIIDASHPEETRVVVLRGNRVEEFDFESASKKPLRGNIYLAKVTRVEPSLQAAFVDYGGNRHGFLAFSEIHPDYYQIPVADRQALLEEEAQSHRDEDDEVNGDRRSRRHRRPRRQEAESRVLDDEVVSEPAHGLDDQDNDEAVAESIDRAEGAAEADLFQPRAESDDAPADGRDHERRAVAELPPPGTPDRTEAVVAEPPSAEAKPSSAEAAPPSAEAAPSSEEAAPSDVAGEPGAREEAQRSEPHSPEVDAEEAAHDDDEPEVTSLEGGAEKPIARARTKSVEEEGELVEHVGGDAMEELPRRPPRFRRQYKIQEVIKRRQVLLVQVVKEERGNKGAALTTYLSLAGRYSVLMPNTARGGGISRKITNAQDRSRLKAIAEELDVPEGMGVILRTAGAARTKAEVKRDFEYLLRMWETVRETTLASSAPTLVYEEGSLIKRAIRDLYTKDVEEIIVAGEAAYREARQFMRLLMPSHVNVVQLYRDTQPVFAKAGVEAQLDAMFSNQVNLKSGGYIVINQTEALVAIDVNSGRSTREHNIEDTALRTNLEAADEIARQLRLRDLAGLIVVDFIDMEESRNNRAVERRIKDALKNDRARIQVGRISHFGLLEMSRQRIRTGVLEGSTVVCPHCQGAGVVRSTASIALHVLRVLEDALIKSSTHDVVVRTRTAVALYILNQKRANLRDLERRFGVAIAVEADDTLTGANYHAIERGEPATGPKPEAAPSPLAQDDFVTVVDEPASPSEEDPSEAQEEEAAGDDAGRGDMREGAAILEEAEGRRRRRRRRRRGGERSLGESVSSDAPQPADDGLAVMVEIGGDLATPVAKTDAFEHRGHRGEGERGRRSRRSHEGRGRFPPRVADDSFAATEAHAEEAHSAHEAEQPVAKVEQSPAPVEEATYAAEQQFEPLQPAAQEARRDEPLASPTLVQERDAEPSSPTTAADEPLPANDEAAFGPMTAPAPETEHPAARPADEPHRPRRTGWWQRARASIVGD
ncbi:MAG TPA: Rne/Rng family ribonuclease [Roseiarcus sp.]|nr:Rne/Rng family ribonuclease [Roseiarcus sp.]